MPPKRKNTQDDPPSRPPSRTRSSSSSSASAPASPAKKSAPASPVKNAAQGKKRPASPTGDSEPPQKVAKKEKAKRDFRGRQCNGRKANGEQCGRRESVKAQNPPPVYYCSAHKPKTTGDGQSQQAPKVTDNQQDNQEAPKPTTPTNGVEKTDAEARPKASPKKRTEDPAPAPTTAADEADQADAEARPPPSPQKRAPKRKRTSQDPAPDDDASPPPSPQKRVPKIQPTTQSTVPAPTTATDQVEQADAESHAPASPQKRPARKKPASQGPVPAATTETDEGEQPDGDAPPPAQAQKRRPGEKHPPGQKRPAEDPVPAPTTATEEAEQPDVESAPPAQAQAQKRPAREKPAAQGPIFERTEPSTDELPEDFNACQYLQDGLESERDYHLDSGLPPAEAEHVYNAIASVTGAITRIQSRRQGFSFFRGDLLNLRKTQGSPGPIVLPDRPLLFPYHHGGEDHVMLVVIQYDESDITIHINDAMAWKWSPAEREDINKNLRRFIQSVGWLRAPPAHRVSICPYINWTIYIDQVHEDSTGYCTIISAWILALGLEPARHTQPFSERDYVDLLRVCGLALTGRADWRVIYAYLVCHRFVEPHSEVPLMRRFRRTERITSEEDLDNFLDKLQLDDEAYWAGLREAERQLHFEVGLLPKVRIDRGYPDNVPWASDSWDDELKEDQARLDGLFKAGVFNSLVSEHEIYDAFKKKWKTEGKKVKEQETKQNEDNDSDAGDDGQGPAITTVDQDEQAEGQAKEQADQPEKRPARKTIAAKAPRKVPRKEPAPGTVVTTVEQDEQAEGEAEEQSDQPQRPITAGKAPRKTTAGKAPRKEPRKQPVPPQEEPDKTPDLDEDTTALKDPPSTARRSSSRSKKSTPRSDGEQSGPDGPALSVIEAKDHSPSGLDNTTYWSVNSEFEEAQGGQMADGAQPGLNGSQGEANDNTQTILIEDSPSRFDVGSDDDVYGEEEEENQEGVEEMVEEEEDQEEEEEQEMVQDEHPPNSGNPLEDFRNQFLQGKKRLHEVGAHVWGFLEDPRNALSISETGDDWCARFQQRHQVLDGIRAAADDERKGDALKALKINWEKDAFDDQVAWPIAAVVAAIDRRQSGLSTTDSFNSGFALAESSEIAAARESVANDLSQEAFAELEYPPVGHGRRCWLMPLVIQNVHNEEEYEDPNPKKKGKKKNVMGRGHVLLAVVQERVSRKAPMSSEFEVLFLDSAPHWFPHARAYREVQEMAQRLRWTQFLNEDEQVPFADEHHTISVPRQQANWTCSLHTIVNAWILALGLQPATEAKATKAKYNDDVYREIINMAELACAGLMDWKTLASWLLYRRLVVNTSLGDVPTNRRFERSLYLTVETLAKVRNDMLIDDALHSSQFHNLPTVSTTPFINRSNNVAWENWEVLTRGYDDFDDSGYEEDAMDIDVDGYGKEDSSAESDRLAWLDVKEGVTAKRDSLDWLEAYDY